jgi:hypothetical protein
MIINLFGSAPYVVYTRTFLRTIHTVQELYIDVLYNNYRHAWTIMFVDTYFKKFWKQSDPSEAH